MHTSQQMGFTRPQRQIIITVFTSRVTWHSGKTFPNLTGFGVSSPWWSWPACETNKSPL